MDEKCSKSKPQWKTQHKVSRTHGCSPKTKASGEKSLEKYMDGPHHLKRNSTHGIVNTTLQKTCFRGAKVFTKMATGKSDDELIQHDNKMRIGTRSGQLIIVD